jgi:hypothetical protein
MDVGYYASRALLSKVANDASAYFVERSATGVAAPAVNSFLAEIASRFGVVVSERIAAGAVPIVGALGGATISVIFLNYFQNIARGHFTVRRLERDYGGDVVRQIYMLIADKNINSRQ